MKKESNGIGENKNSKKISKNNKIISSILAVIMCCQSLVGAVPLNTDGKVNVAGSPVSDNSDNIDSENDLKDSEGEDEGNNKDFIKKKEDSRKSKGILEKIKDNYFKLAVGGLGLAVPCAAGFALWLRKLNNDEEPHNIDAEKPIGSGVGFVASNSFKVVLVGGQKVGKTGFSDVLCGRFLSENYVPTIGAEYYQLKKNCVEGEKISLEIWSTTGQEKHHSLLSIYVRNARVICVCFDLTKKDGHTNENETINSYLHYWVVYLVREYCPENAKFMFIGCKSDLTQELKIEDNEIENAISGLGLGNRVIKDSSNNRSFFKTSAKSGDGIQEVLNAISSNVTVKNKHLI
ncbi:MAG: small GTP-binding protein [Candidatus Improbicoccus pseudotrichonymphae]|uniref:Small GTP-binding protein n=1 Tax=Candidatus Improbicoccus pseudotrichonymphae TaxID=3033792 RepID=A0AA48I8W3_9FIRM|nr:MAG: small GTP-binding protein [Candidatus Improbicoccus pseudotrichonymphae]